ncbi:hypothetical protein WR25_18077 [Diploscapter pachys]|uniref:E2F-associated phosphoprotein n=1 Tax=Diploscapter pachys TaxID=2018661 RepID=A0A2A2LKE5_9BILA|nr:hypothetical protein WR25_18077 [Diploscapter pachys]
MKNSIFRGQKRREQSEFECDMETELDLSIAEYADRHMNMTGVSKAMIENVKEEPSTSKISKYFDDGPPPLEGDGEFSDDAMGEFFIQMKKGIETSSSSKEPPKSASQKSPKKSILKKPKLEKNDEGIECGDGEKEDEKEDNPIKTKVRIVAEDFKKEQVEFYDENEDDENERWIAEERRKRKGQQAGEKTGKDNADSKQKKGKAKNLDNDTDAVLSCPGCMSLLTRDCQRHEIYKDQYRAMFVENCKVEEEKLTIEKTGKEKRKMRQKMKKSGIAIMEASPDDVFQPVKCTVCDTNVAVMDQDEVFHFFNVLAGYS